MEHLACIIMAAGLGKRMKSNLPKVLHKLNGKPLIQYVVDKALSCGANPIVVVVGHKREMVMELLGEKVKYAIQEQQLGTGHAVMQAEPYFRLYQGSILILSGDVPLLTVESVKRLVELHHSERNACTLISCIVDNPQGYGRVIRSDDGAVEAVIEDKDASDQQLAIKEINSGIYIVEAQILFEALRHIDNNNAQGEYYLPDILPYIIRKGLRIGGLVLQDPLEIAGVNSKSELARLEKEYLDRKRRDHPTLTISKTCKHC